MIPLANSGALWKEPKAVALSASRVVIAANGDGTWSFVTAAEAAAMGGPAAEMVETSPGAYTVTPIGTADAGLARGTAVKIGSRITTILP